MTDYETIAYYINIVYVLHCCVIRADSADPCDGENLGQIRAYGEGWVDGVEVVNGTTFYPEMIDRCVDEKLFISANTDVHRPSSQVWARDCGIFRTMTFVLANECTEEAIKEALLQRRTICYSANNLIGEEVWLKDFLNQAVDCRMITVNDRKGHRSFQFTNTCSILFIFRNDNRAYLLEPFQSLRLDIARDKETGVYGDPEFIIDNMWTVGDKHPKFIIEIDE